MAQFKKGILYIALYVLVIATISFPFTGAIVARMRDDLLKGQYTLVQTQPLELMMLELKLSFIIGVIAALPILFFFGYRYLIKARLGGRFRVSKIKMIFVGVIALALFMLGCAYSYYLMLPLVFQYLLQSATDVGVANHWRVSEFINFAMLTTFVFGMVFELPLVMTVLARSGIVPVEVFKKYRRHMYVIIFIVAALVTSPDVLTQIMVGVPLVIFYEISLLSMRFTVPRRSPQS
ncbi:twin-arginine translocase subunit TatC [Methanocella conradii]|uniref:twin-arginine translocase subunit TatC n=1 Tax=Methanocella conradii TaxID=1175444 RepID=UPI00157D51CA|nr:twin-arginine translocase subunit TatC [Methanocella conradii]